MKKKKPKYYPRKSYSAHYTGVLLEEIRDQVKSVAEGLEMTREELKAEIGGVKSELKQEIADTRTALTIRIDNVEKELRTEISAVRTELSGKIDAIGTRLDHDEHEIQELKQAQNSL